ncbi:unnamed protein product [Rotaria sp. Silwood1]|nr:unnamed protein product [Rotaria sp. Silwood1]CAF1278501.1 unnamed protein product [Rotaria sp. Silwood1]CAF3477057.1 unnamed protein product [Rotaria sp. Silwood1]CAF5048714.1 unnamed protein product [Rotaria sp. Silwood1]
MYLRVIAEITSVIKRAQDNNDHVELLVVEKYFYDKLKENDISFNPIFAITIDTPKTMFRDCQNFLKHEPRICEIYLNETD